MGGHAVQLVPVAEAGQGAVCTLPVFDDAGVDDGHGHRVG
jgi:hypothetical protein